MNPAKALQVLRELELSIEGANYKQSTELVTKFREAIAISMQSFALSVGVDVRTVRRWETESESSSPPLAKVRTWARLFELDRTNDESESVETLPTTRGNLPGIFRLEDILKRISDSHEIYDLKCRMRFRAGATPFMETFFEKKLAAEKDFKMHCAWIQPSVEANAEKNMNDVRPMRIARESFVDFKVVAEKAVTDVENRIIGYELSPIEACKSGFGDSPAAVLVIKYKEDKLHKYRRKVDVFIEISAAMYHEKSRMIVESPESIFIQVDPPIAREYCKELWDVSKLLDAKKRADALVEARRAEDQKELSSKKPTPPTTPEGKQSTTPTT